MIPLHVDCVLHLGLATIKHVGSLCENSCWSERYILLVTLFIAKEITQIMESIITLDKSFYDFVNQIFCNLQRPHIEDGLLIRLLAT